MVAFAPHGGVGFSIASRRAGFADANVAFHSNLPEALPFEPDWILFDVERAWFVFGTPPSDGNGQTETPYWEDVTVMETWRDQRLIRRSFVRNGTPDTDIEYEPGLTLTAEGLTALPTLVRLTNHRFEYTIELSSISSAADPSIGDGR